MSSLAVDRRPTPAAATTPPRRRFRKRPWLAAVALLGLAAAVAAGLVARSRYVATIACDTEAALAALDRSDPGWRLDAIEAARAPVPEAQNSATVVLAAARLIPDGWPLRRASALKDDEAEPIANNWLTRLDEVEPNRRLDDRTRAVLGAELKALAPALSQARRLADMPNGRHPIDRRENPRGAADAWTRPVSDVVRLLRLDARLRADSGDVDGAIASMKAALNAARSVGDEPDLAMQTLRLREVAQALLVLEEALGQGEASDGALQGLQSLLETESAHPGLRLALRGERAALAEFYGRLAAGRLRSLDGGAEADVPEWRRRLYMGAVFEWERRVIVEDFTENIALLALPDAERATAMAERIGRIEAALAESPVLESHARMFAPDLRSLMIQDDWNRANLAYHLAAIASERFRMARGRWPLKSDELAPAFLARVPNDPNRPGLATEPERLIEGLWFPARVALPGRPAGRSVGSRKASWRSRRDYAVAGATTVFLFDVDHRRLPALPASGVFEDDGDVKE